MRDVFPPRDVLCELDPKVSYAGLAEIEQLAGAAFPNASAIVPRVYDGQPIAEVYTNGSARVLSREQLRAVLEVQRLALQGESVREHLAAANCVLEVISC